MAPPFFFWFQVYPNVEASLGPTSWVDFDDVVVQFFH